MKEKINVQTGDSIFDKYSENAAFFIRDDSKGGRLIMDHGIVHTLESIERVPYRHDLKHGLAVLSESDDLHLKNEPITSVRNELRVDGIENTGWGNILSCLENDKTIIIKHQPDDEILLVSTLINGVDVKSTTLDLVEAQLGKGTGAIKLSDITNIKNAEKVDTIDQHYLTNTVFYGSDEIIGFREGVDIIKNAKQAVLSIIDNNGNSETEDNGYQGEIVTIQKNEKLSNAEIVLRTGHLLRWKQENEPWGFCWIDKEKNNRLKILKEKGK
jgi:hypothetical protein